jgi:hypothetical protein
MRRAGQCRVVQLAALEHRRPRRVYPSLSDYARTGAGGDAQRCGHRRWLRYASGALSSGLASSGCGIVSVWSTWLAKNLFPHRLAGVSDPMSGLSRSGGTSVSLDRLKPVVFKILLEILVRHSQGTGRVGCVLASRHGMRADPRHPFTRPDPPAPHWQAASDRGPRTNSGRRTPLRQRHSVRTVSGQGMLGI